MADSTADLADVAFTEIWTTIVSSVPSRMHPDTLGRMEKPDGINGNGPGSAPLSKDWKMEWLIGAYITDDPVASVQHSWRMRKSL